jgi:phenylacetate-CoA ligase
MMERFFTAHCLFKKIYREGYLFKRYLRELQQSYRLSADELAAYQRRQLRDMVQHCYKNIPYYRDQFRQLGLKPDMIRTLSDLSELPILDKQTVKDNFDKLIDRKRLTPWCHKAKTSGTTGSPGVFIRDRDAIVFEHAAVWRQWAQAGDTGKKRVTIRGGMVVPMTQAEPPFWRYNPIHRELIMCCYHLSPKTGKAYIDKILEFKPSVLYSSPTIVYTLAKLFKAYRVRYPFEHIFMSSENLSSEMAQLIRQVFDAPISDWYGQAERVAAIATCPQGTYHIQEDYSLVELIDTPNGKELVGTQLRNKVMPLLRYRTGDYVADESPDCTCGSNFRTVANIIGRLNAYLVTPEGYRIFNTTHIPASINNLIETQFVQEKPGEVRIKVLTNGSFQTEDREALIQKTLQYTSPTMKVEIEEVSHIPRGPNGKFISILNQVESLN